MNWGEDALNVFNTQIHPFFHQINPFTSLTY